MQSADLPGAEYQHWGGVGKNRQSRRESTKTKHFNIAATVCLKIYLIHTAVCPFLSSYAYKAV